MLLPQNQKSLRSLPKQDFPVIHRAHGDASPPIAPATIQMYLLKLYFLYDMVYL